MDNNTRVNRLSTHRILMKFFLRDGYQGLLLRTGLSNSPAAPARLP
jgi:hypothetical protein